MDHKFTAQIKEWLETPESELDYSVGALYLLKLSGNQILYKNIVAALDRQLNPSCEKFSYRDSSSLSKSGVL